MIDIDTSLRAADFRNRNQPWTMILTHHTGIGDRQGPEISDSLWETLYTNISAYLARKDNIYVSSHYVISRKGEIKELVDPSEHVAYHAGVSSYWNPIQRRWMKNCNDFSIGVELIGDGNKVPFTTEQYEAHARLNKYLMTLFPTICFLAGHEMVSPGRKDDPGKWFDYKLLHSLTFRT